ncbi:puromycin-sensitive aminopeptidase-like isoform X2 [Pomacea canaliculata]|uniref:puromycin-sensitive aminopeptidase-like isoform X2 n=1 Tax=Pomacea canaliculata TaxID=400727 RepID=UPI000D725E53|nr:puromycin-sensitive aminopeptidase-like isoform X2 [Pomacea canaliculata]
MTEQLMNDVLLEKPSTADRTMASTTFQRLPKNMIPVNYVIKLKPDLQALTFDGEEEVELEVKEATSYIIINAKDIRIQEAFIIEDGNKSPLKISYREKEEQVSFILDRPLKAGICKLSLKYTGNLNDELRGFYRSSYKTTSGEQRYAAVTHFEATGARRAFPCWDEPAIRATFDIILIVPKERVALSNMPVKQEKPWEGDSSLKEVIFERTPVMSTYLVAFVVGEYDFVEAVDANGVKVRVYTPPQKQEQGLFALEVAVKTLPFYGNYFQLAYDLPKLDLIAVADFPIGAMENWGLIIYRETALLVDPVESSAGMKQWVSLVVGHELAHNWFGNLVTMEWWTHLWLKEGFASWIEYLCVDHCFPEFDVWTQFVTADLGKALTLDAMRNSHPIEIEVRHPSEVDEIFDAISYSKGASVIRMLHSYLGDQDFCKGMNLYLIRHQYKSACTADLWAALEEVSGKPVASIMSTWTSQAGFPVLKVTQKWEEDKCVLEITQRKFSAEPLPDGSSKDDKNLWMVPITVITKSSPKEPVSTALMEADTITIPLQAKDGEWIKINAGTVSVYRVQYSSEMLNALVNGIQTGTLLPTDRFGIQSDLYALCRSGLVNSVEFLQVVETFTAEDNYTVWKDLLSNLHELGKLLQYTKAYSHFNNFVIRLLQPTFMRLGWDSKAGEGHLTAILRELVLSKMGAAGANSIIAEARKRFQAHCSETEIIPGDLRSPVYITVLSHGNKETLESMLKLYRTADSSEEKTRIIHSLGCLKDETLIAQVLRFSISDEVKSQDCPFVIGATAQTAQGRELAWQFVKDNFCELHRRYSSTTLFARLIKMTIADFATEKKAADIKSFFKQNPATSAARTVQQCCENIHVNALWLERDAELVKEFLQGRYQAVCTSN